MKKVLASLMAVGLMATAANAATIGLRWAEAPGSQNLVATQGTIEVYMQLLAGEQISTVTFFLDADDDNLVVTSKGTNVPNWLSAGSAAGTNLDGHQFGVFTNTDNVAGPQADIVFGFLGIDAGAPDDLIKNIYALIPGNPAGVLDETGARLIWDARYNQASAGYIAFGNWGNPGWGTNAAMGHQPTANPLQITKTPEPASLALVALGGFALLRRRR